MLRRYCALLSVPITVGEGAQPVNDETPPWRETVDGEHPTLTQRRALEFATHFDTRFEPLATITVPFHDKSESRGLLWINGGRSYATSDQRRLAVFVRGMLLDDDARDLLPSWAGFVSGVIESSALTPTASCEDLQRDAVWTALEANLAERVALGLAEIASSQPEAWRRVLMRHNEALLGAALCDAQLFDLLMDQVTIPTTQGDMTARAAAAGGTGTLHVSIEADEGMTGTLFKALRIPVARGDRFGVLPFVRRYAVARGQRIAEIGTSSGDETVFRPAQMNPSDMEWLTEALATEGEDVVASRFAPPQLPLVVIPDREAMLKKAIEDDEADGRIASAALRMARIHTKSLLERPLRRLYVNMDSPAIQCMLDARTAHPRGAALAARALRGLKRLNTTTSLDHADDLLKALEDLSEVVSALCAGSPK